MIPIIDINIPLRLLRNATYTGMSSAKEVLDLSWDLKELQEFFFLYAQNTEAANLKARNLFQAKIDSQLAVHYDHHPSIPDFVDSDEDYGTYSLNAIHAAPSKISSEIKDTKPTKKAKASKKSEKTKKKAFKKELLRVLDEPVPAFDSAKVEKSVVITKPVEVKTTTVGKQLTTAAEVVPIVAESTEDVDFEIGLTESRVPAAVSTIQIARHSIFAIVQKFKSTFVGPLPLPALPSLQKLQLDSAFWYNLSMAQKIERPLGFELVHTGLSANASIDRSSIEFNTQSPALFSLAAMALKGYNSVLKSIEFVRSVVDTKLIEPPTKEVKLIMPPMAIYEAGPSSKTKKQEVKSSRAAPVKPGASKKARRHRRKRSRSKKAKKAKKLTRAAALKRTTKVKAPITIEDLDKFVKAEKSELLENIPSFDVALPEMSDEADSDRDIIEVDDLPAYLDADEIEDKKANTLQVGQLSMYHHFMNLIRLAALHVPTLIPSVPEKTNNLQVGQLSMYHTFMKLLKLSEDYHHQKRSSQMHKVVKYYHSLGPSKVLLASVAIELPINEEPSISSSGEGTISQNTEACPTNEEPDSFLQNNQKSDDTENTSSEDVEMNDTSDSTPVSSPECKPSKRRFSKKPSFPKNAKKTHVNVTTAHVGLTSNAKHRRQRAKKAQRNREFSKISIEAAEIKKKFATNTTYE